MVETDGLTQDFSAVVWELVARCGQDKGVGRCREDWVEGRKRRKGFLQGVTLEPRNSGDAAQKGLLSSAG